MRVGGRDFDQTKRQIEMAMEGVEPEEARKYLVEVNGLAYPPKQVLAHVTGWERQSFTTMEAQRVLKKVGFSCREAVALSDGRESWVSFSGKGSSPAHHVSETVRAQDIQDRVHALDAALTTAQVAIASLDARLRKLEDAAD